MLKFDTPIQFVKGVGPKMSQRLKKIGIENIQDLLFYFPRSWDDLSVVTPVNQIKIGNNYNIYAKIVEIGNHRTPKKRMNITTVLAKDKSGGEIKILWFNQPFLTRNFKTCEWWIFSGKIEWDFSTKSKIMVSPTYEKKAAIISIYPETEGVNSKYLRRLASTLIALHLPTPEFLPDDFLKKESLMGLEEAISEIHLPSSIQKLYAAKRRLAFDELFLIILRMMCIKKELAMEKSPQLDTKVQELVKFSNDLPYKLTDAQRKASWEIIKDTARTIPMNRLLEGDVGSGKTVVAAMAALNAIKNEYQVVWMAPTEILANQHFESANKLFKDFDIKISLLTGSQVRVKSKSGKNNIKELKSLAQNSDLIIGTHALIQEGIKFPNLGLVIIDEQHRFGVRQRFALTQTSYSKLTPHFLSMTATPIPRTLALSLYGDLDISVINEMPPGRQKIITQLVDPVNREKAYHFARQEIQKGHQMFVICPLIEIKNKKPDAKSQNLFESERKSVLKEYEKLRKEIFPELNIAYLHGKMKSKEKERIMADFSAKGESASGGKNKKIHILVATSVIEVGIDIPNATLMMIEDADRFGLAQLHQFRGRIGRGKHQSYCLIFTQSLSPETIKRLQILVDCADGFRLAEKDLALRGPGELAGALQHGMPDLKMASLTDIILINLARSVAEKIVGSGLENYPMLVKKLKEFEMENHLE